MAVCLRLPFARHDNGLPGCVCVVAFGNRRRTFSDCFVWSPLCHGQHLLQSILYPVDGVHDLLIWSLLSWRGVR